MTAPPATSDAPRDASPGSTRGERFGWLASLVLHGAVLGVLAGWTLPDLPHVLGPLLIAEPAEDETPEAPLLAEEPLTLDPNVSQPVAALTEVAPDAAAPAPPRDEPAPPTSFALSPATLVAPTPNGADELGLVGVAGRGDAARGALLKAKGGTQASEMAVGRALRWLTAHQNSDGSWSLDHTGGECRGRCANPSSMADPAEVRRETLRCGTALALLPFLGAGETHERGRHRLSVRRGIDALVKLAEPNREGPGADWSDRGQLYSHGLAAIALCEAFNMSRDERLRAPAQAAIDFIGYAQDPTGGGWRYRPRQPGDTSVTGWQVMALKSASLADLRTPRSSATLTRRFLDAAAESGGARYRYRPADPLEETSPPPLSATRPLTAVALLCRMYLGWEADDPRLIAGAEWVAEQGPSPTDYYFNYYAAQTLFHYTGGEGPVWRKWNEALRDQLVEQQSRRGHERGSWWIDDNHNRRGGRLYTTSLATMTLEVYYRYLPLYQSAAVQAEFPE
ncbi:prenyltransferase/squalene oxidase repeat-containing protein [Botrimarina hoheduenensis]|uniref:Squalene cyclase C-terminal domain-containing protein n=1 Tax=Botrimarina hoheduenensis TaxID=2528000 RepID=A0A5C5W9A8_9BACT|nr:prenyltransferase/squalene oxidase repeat-containing protein [Botrimarina hoheduenensis]TWT47250.1 hypothetical protein Pla111_08620 [Botrimarina hoheduenensis]